MMPPRGVLGGEPTAIAGVRWVRRFFHCIDRHAVVTAHAA
jgi:hypothetical protein